MARPRHKPARTPASNLSSPTPARDVTSGVPRINATSPTNAADAVRSNRSRLAGAAALESDAQTESLIRRVLGTHQTPTAGDLKTSKNDTTRILGLLPNLTSYPELDIQLYAFVAIVIKEFVNPWYSKITSDQEFVHEVVLLVAHCTRALEERMKKVDWEPLLLDELPKLLDVHITAFRIANAAAISTASNIDTDFDDAARQLYHALRPHPALSPVPGKQDPAKTQRQLENDTSYRQILAQKILTILLPGDDRRNPCLFSLVADILADLVLGGLIGKKFCESIFLFNSIETAMTALRPQLNIEPWAFDYRTRPKDRLVQLGLISRQVSRSTGKADTSSVGRAQLFWTIMGYLVLVYGAVRVCFSWILGSASLPSRCGSRNSNNIKSASAHKQFVPAQAQNTESLHATPILDYHLWQVVMRVIRLESRMPWLHGFLALIQHISIHGPGKIAGTNGRLDRLLAHGLLTPLRSAGTAHLPDLLKRLRVAVFPRNTFVAPETTASVPAPVHTAVFQDRSISATSEASIAGTAGIAGVAGSAGTSIGRSAEARRAAALAILNLLPQAVARLYFAPGPPLNLSFLRGGRGGPGDRQAPGDGQAPGDEQRLGKEGGSQEGGSQEGGSQDDSSSRYSRSSKATETVEEQGQASAEEQGQQRRELEEMIQGAEQLLDIFADEYMNKHLMYALLERILAAVMPELAADCRSDSLSSVE